MNKVFVDPFFDGGGGGQSNTRAQYATKNTDKYQDIEVEKTSRSVPIKQLMPEQRGISGVIIPRSTPGGVPAGSHIHDVKDVELIIDPHIAGQSAVVKLGNLSKEKLQKAASYAAAHTPDPVDPETTRLRGAATMHALGDIEESMRNIPEADNFQPVQPKAVEEIMEHPSIQATPATSETAKRIVSPLQAFSQAKAAAQQPKQLAGQSNTVAQVPCSPPGIQVVFELQHFGRLEVAYHDVLVQEGFIVLVYDNDYTAGSRYFPPAAAEQDAPAMAMNVIGTQDIYLVHTTGIQFTHGSCEYCILMVENSATL